MRKVRIKRNDSTHENIATEQESDLENAAVAIAEKEAAIAERDKRLAELEAEIEKARKERAAIQNLTPQSALTKQQRQNSSAVAISKAKLTEAQTRAIIDEQLRKVGWEAGFFSMTYERMRAFFLNWIFF